MVQSSYTDQRVDPNFFSLHYGSGKCSKSQVFFCFCNVKPCTSAPSTYIWPIKLMAFPELSTSMCAPSVIAHCRLQNLRCSFLPTYLLPYIILTRHSLPKTRLCQDTPTAYRKPQQRNTPIWESHSVSQRKTIASSPCRSITVGGTWFACSHFLIFRLSGEHKDHSESSGHCPISMSHYCQCVIRCSQRTNEPSAEL